MRVRVNDSNISEHFGLCMGGILGGVDLRGVYNNLYTVQSEIQILDVHEALKPYVEGQRE